VYERLKTQIGELRDRLGGLPSPEEAQDIWRGIWIEEAHHSTAIEGNTLVLRQVQQLLDEGLAVGGRELKEYMEVRGYANAAEWVYQQGVEPGSWSDTSPITLTELRQIHRLALGPVWDVAPHPDATPSEGPGSFREHEIEEFPEGMVASSWPHVAADVAAWLDECSGLASVDPVALPEALAKVHARFEQIHPFLDGNGRTGRLVLNLILVRLGYPPAIIYKRDRSPYLAALRRADHGDLGSLAELLARAILDNYYKFIVPAIAGPSRMVPLPSLATPAVTAEALRAAAARGTLKASRAPDGTWRSSQALVREYLASRRRRRVPKNSRLTLASVNEQQLQWVIESDEGTGSST
jgi:fido (protein-threonine AMPylation protein)